MSDMVKVTPKNIVDEARDMPWKVAIEPFRVAPRVHYVGNVWVGSFLVDTEEGLAIIDTTVMEDLYLLLESIRKLGFDPMNIKKIFLTHAHMDHDGAARALKEMTGAELYLSKEDEDWRHRPEADMHDIGSDFSKNLGRKEVFRFTLTKNRLKYTTKYSIYTTKWPFWNEM